MKLYSRGQMIRMGIAVFAFAVILGFAGFAGFSALCAGAAAGNAEAVAADSGNGSGTKGDADRDEPVVEAMETASSGSDYSQDEKDNISIYERLNSGVVNITTEVVAVNWFMEPVPQEGASGSGSIIDQRGYVLTNVHVVKDAYKVFVNLADGDSFEGKVVGTDPENDIAVIKFDPPKDKKLSVVPFGSSSSLKVGQKVLAIGNPFGLDRTLTAGIISSLGRPVQKDDGFVIRGMIQTDAAINPGNSGGPLLNSKGEMIGITTMIYSPSGGSVGVGFAVPVDTARRVVPELLQYGSVKRGWIEIQYVQLFPELVAYMKESSYPVPVEKGILVSQTVKAGNADRAGLRGGSTPIKYGRSVFNLGGDIIVSIDGFAVTTIADVYSALEDNKPGDKVKVEYYRNGTKMTATVELTDRSSLEK